MGRLHRTKNIHGEQDTLQQFVFTAINPWHDAHFCLGLWLEYSFEFHQEENKFKFCVDDQEDPICIKDKIHAVLVNIFKDDEFII